MSMRNLMTTAGMGSGLAAVAILTGVLATRAPSADAATPGLSCAITVNASKGNGVATAILGAPASRKATFRFSVAKSGGSTIEETGELLGSGGTTHAADIEVQGGGSYTARVDITLAGSTVKCVKRFSVSP